MKKKSLYDLSWQVSEDEYRSDSALSYSTLAKYERTGFNGIDNLFDKIETPSLTFGSAVDALITGGQEEFDERFMVADFPIISDTIIKIVKDIFREFGDTHRSLNIIPDIEIIGRASNYSYQPNWRPETRAKVIREKGADYYNLLYIAGDRTIINNDTYQSICSAVNVLKTSEATKFYFEDNDLFGDIERLYQLKFKACLEGIEYRCMFDELIIDHKNKTIQPIDLKTSCKSNDREWNFCEHYIEWNYQIQNRLYVRILQEVIRKDDFYKYYLILPYKDIIIFKGSDTPLVWDIPFTFDIGILFFGKNNQIEMRDPFDIGRELSYYLSSRPKVPMGIKETESNNIKEWLNKL